MIWQKLRGNVGARFARHGEADLEIAHQFEENVDFLVVAESELVVELLRNGGRPFVAQLLVCESAAVVFYLLVQYAVDHFRGPDGVENDHLAQGSVLREMQQNADFGEESAEFFGRIGA